LIAYCRAHQGADPAALSTIEGDLIRLQTLLNTQESDDVDALLATVDESFKEAFHKYDGGTLWHYHQKDPKAQPTSTELENLRTMNEAQAVLSNLTRETSSVRWQIFAEWWSYGKLVTN